VLLIVEIIIHSTVVSPTIIGCGVEFASPNVIHSVYPCTGSNMTLFNPKGIVIYPEALELSVKACNSPVALC